jgi:hypothetical protein
MATGIRSSTPAPAAWTWRSEKLREGSYIPGSGAPPLLGHFAPIETKFLGRACERFWGAGLPWPIVDTLQLQHRLVTTAWPADPPAGRCGCGWRGSATACPHRPHPAGCHDVGGSSAPGSPAAGSGGPSPSPQTTMADALEPPARIRGRRRSRPAGSVTSPASQSSTRR